MAMLILHFLFSLVYRGSETDKIRPESPAYCPVNFITDVPVISSPMFIVRLNVAEDNMTNICFRKEGLHWSKQPRTVQACCKEVLVAGIRLANRHAGIVDKEFHIPLFRGQGISFCTQLIESACLTESLIESLSHETLQRHGYWLQRLSPNYHSNSQQALRLSISMATMAAFAASWPPAGRAPLTFLDMEGSGRTGHAGGGRSRRRWQQQQQQLWRRRS
uniref:Uncharacterized protein n=1 Tax=Oryza glumipatula TaxID=40148 RepID=A0A0D9ZBV1_9ORYZ